MKASPLRALQGAVLAIGSPLGWLAIRMFDGADPLLELTWRGGVYLYMLVGTVTVFAAFGWYVGRQEEHHRETSLHDSVTGLYNARYFRRRLEEELAFAGRHARPLSLLMGDLDFFKRVNDVHGHAVGDEVLAGVGAAFMKLRRRGDTVARVGGEEFAVILPDTDLAEATHVAERLRKAVAALPFSVASTGRHFVVTMSLGAVAAPLGRGISATELFEAADAAMYRAKGAGRNCVSAAAADLHVPPMVASA
jgi:diguanylate cyclase (GGDEF)-like protein